MYLAEDQLILSPSDLNGFVSCAHLTSLDLGRLHGEIPDERVRGAEADLLARKGDEHERAYLEQLRAQGKRVAEIPPTDDNSLESLRGAADRTEEEMRAGAEVIYQGTFFRDGFRGHTDFLFRVDEGPSALGAWSYEVADTKLARRAKPYFILQLCFYSEMLAGVQRVEPERIHVVLGDPERTMASYRLVEFSAYFRRVRERFLATRGGPFETYPEPVEHCAVCGWRERCDAQRERDDHLSLVAGIMRAQREKLGAAGVQTLAELGRLPAGAVIDGIRPPILTKLREQASLQLRARELAPELPDPLLLEPEEGRGFARLPEPSPGDVFFDMEGDPFFEGGLEYLFGLVTCDGEGGAGEPAFTALWGRDRGEERRALEGFIDLVGERLERWPQLHVYHYNHYEVTALKRLCQTHATREEELDQLLRREVFVDLLKVVREGMRIGRPGYGLKEVERYFMPARDTDVSDGGDSVVEFERWLDGDPRGDEILAAIADYNRDDCVSTLRLRDWLLGWRQRAGDLLGAEIPWFAGAPQPKVDGEAREEGPNEALQRELLATVPEDAEDRSAAESTRWLLAQLLSYHRREERPVWWEFFDRVDREPEDLVDDVDCLGDLRPIPGVEPESVRRSTGLTMRFPAQETKVREGGKYVDPAGARLKLPEVTVEELDLEAATVQVVRGPTHDGRPWPRALIPGRPIPTDAQKRALGRLADQVLHEGLGPAGSYRAARDMLVRRPPRVRGRAEGEPLHGEPAEIEELRALVRDLDESYLMIQGPPGSGKTWSGAHLIVDLIGRGARVGVTSTSHKAIHNLLDAIEEHAAEVGLTFRGLKKCGGGEGTEYTSAHVESTKDNAAFHEPDVALAAGTAWHFCREEFDGTLDYLFVDEAGQISLADALALATSARNVVLLGDPQQLAQVSQGRHPEGSAASILEHLLGAAQTIPPDRGVFLGRTWRMHPDVCEFVSELMYDGRLFAAPGRGRQRILGGGSLGGTGLRWLPVEHEGNGQSSIEEAERIAAALRELEGASYVDCDGEELPLRQEDVLVVTPFNAQVKCLAAKLPAGTRIGTVDKFQGQEAQLVFFSMASSSGADVPRGLEFLFSRNRLNVAISRARCVAVLVSSPQLLDISCRSVEQMRLVNAVCRVAEVSRR